MFLLFIIYSLCISYVSCALKRIMSFIQARVLAHKEAKWSVFGAERKQGRWRAETCDWLSVLDEAE